MTPTSVGMRCPECSRERTKVKTVRSPSPAASLTLMLVVVNVVLFLGETATGTPLGGVSGNAFGTLFVKGALFGPYVVDLHQYYRLVTAGFLHDGIFHILFNMWFLWVMGRVLEPAVGRINFAVIYFVSLLAGSFGSLLFEPQVPTVGASGACFGILGALIVISHHRGISIWQSGLGLTLVINIVFSLSVPGISIGGHIGGVIAGAICGLLIVQVGERRRMPAAAIAGCVVLGVISVVAAIAVAGGQGLTPNGLSI
jgi:membrane associated rhomboid family serine protease